jgi:hypothetical protein
VAQLLIGFNRAAARPIVVPAAAGGGGLGGPG